MGVPMAGQGKCQLCGTTVFNYVGRPKTLWCSPQHRNAAHRMRRPALREAPWSGKMVRKFAVDWLLMEGFSRAHIGSVLGLAPVVVYRRTKKLAAMPRD